MIIFDCNLIYNTSFNLSILSLFFISEKLNNIEVSLGILPFIGKFNILSFLINPIILYLSSIIIKINLFFSLFPWNFLLKIMNFVCEIIKKILFIPWPFIELETNYVTKNFCIFFIFCFLISRNIYFIYLNFFIVSIFNLNI